jgi:hypothetical protein
MEQRDGDRNEGWQATRKARFYVVGLTGLPCQSISSLVLAHHLSASMFRSSVHPFHLSLMLSQDPFNHACPSVDLSPSFPHLQANMSRVSFHLVLRLGYKHL